MGKSGTLALLAALVAFLAFFGNVALGASGRDVLLDDVAELLAMVAAAVLFTIGVLQREAADERQETSESREEKNDTP